MAHCQKAIGGALVLTTSQVLSTLFAVCLREASCTESFDGSRHPYVSATMLEPLFYDASAIYRLYGAIIYSSSYPYATSGSPGFPTQSASHALYGNTESEFVVGSHWARARRILLILPILETRRPPARPSISMAIADPFDMMEESGLDTPLGSTVRLLYVQQCSDHGRR